MADYIPELGKINKHLLGISVLSCGGHAVSAGDCRTVFTLQSISKIISLLVALEDWGEEAVFRKVGMEPSADVFNSIKRLETNEDNRPLNPMINAGAIVVASLIRGRNVEERFSKVLRFLQSVTGNPSLSLNKEVYWSEKKTGDRNRALAYFMKSTGVIESDVEEALDLYFQLSSINVTCMDLAKIGCFLAGHGGNECGEVSVSPAHVRIVLAIMQTSGMYNGSGEFAIRVGIPAKSGVSGGIVAVVPGKMGIGVFGPAIDKKGNSIAGVEMLKMLSEHLSLSFFGRLNPFHAPVSR